VCKNDNQMIAAHGIFRTNQFAKRGLVKVIDLGTALIEHTGLAVADIARAQQLGEARGCRLSFMVAQLGLVDDEMVAGVLGKVTGLCRAETSTFPEEMPQIDGLNLGWLQRNAVLPLGMDDHRLEVAMADPLDSDAIAGLAFATERLVVPRIGLRSDIMDHLAAIEGGGAQFGEESSSDDLDRFTDSESDAPVIRLVDRLMARAVKSKASDVHIEPMARALSIRFRIDGTLREIERHPPGLAEALASRIKVMAQLDISESRLPQDGRLRLTVAGRDVDVRVSTSPAAHGESIVLRLLGRSELPLDLGALGLGDDAHVRLKESLARPHGIIFLTGPTGSGKTTTLYAALSHLRRPDVKILSVEDPVEILLEGVNQVQVRPEIDLTYAKALRAFLRQDPDILMIGEIRDRETADIALRAALTGHLVLTTLHTNSALGAFTRLADIGIEPYLTASTTIATIAQRLVRTLCLKCRIALPINDALAGELLGTGIKVPKNVFGAGGCADCNQSGYKGRTPIIEIIELDEALRQAIREGSAEQFPTAPGGTLYDHGLRLIADGKISQAELMRVTGSQ